MPFFSGKKSSSEIVPVATKFDDEWFESWWARLTTEAGVDPADERGQLELRWLTSVFLERRAEKVMTGMGHPESYLVFERGLDSVRTPARMVSLLVGWNRDLLVLMDQILEENGKLMVEGGRRFGHFRFGMDGLK